MPEDEIEIGLPDKLELHNRGSHIEIVWKWFGWQIIFLTGFAVIWDGFLFVWYSMAFGAAPSVGGINLMVLFPLLHVAVGLGFTYYVIAGWFNRTHILVSRGEIAVGHGPIPWPGSKLLPAADIKQVWASEQGSRSSDGPVTYQVAAVTRGGRNVKLVTGLESREQALYIE